MYDDLIWNAAVSYGIPPALIKAIIRVESNFDPRVVSRRGAMGLMQLMPSTARSMGVMDTFDPRQNIMGGTRYFRLMVNRFGGRTVLAVAAYNAGPGAVQRYRGVPPYEETRRYVGRVTTYYQHYLGDWRVRD